MPDTPDPNVLPVPASVAWRAMLAMFEPSTTRKEFYNNHNWAFPLLSPNLRMAPLRANAALTADTVLVGEPLALSVGRGEWHLVFAGRNGKLDELGLTFPVFDPNYCRREVAGTSLRRVVTLPPVALPVESRIFLVTGDGKILGHIRRDDQFDLPPPALIAAVPAAIAALPYVKFDNRVYPIHLGGKVDDLAQGLTAEERPTFLSAITQVVSLPDRIRHYRELRQLAVQLDAERNRRLEVERRALVAERERTRGTTVSVLPYAILELLKFLHPTEVMTHYYSARDVRAGEGFVAVYLGGMAIRYLRYGDGYRKIPTKYWTRLTHKNAWAVFKLSNITDQGHVFDITPYDIVYWNYEKGWRQITHYHSYNGGGGCYGHPPVTLRVKNKPGQTTARADLQQFFTRFKNLTATVNLLSIGNTHPDGKPHIDRLKAACSGLAPVRGWDSDWAKKEH